MNHKVKLLSVAFCVIVIAGSYICYSVNVSGLYFDIARPDLYSMISSYDTEEVWSVPASEAAWYGAYSEEDMQVIGITYELYNPFNEVITIPGNLCSYTGKGGEWIPVYDLAGSEADISRYENCKILPPGESMIFSEYVLVPEGMDEIYASGNFGTTEKVLLKL